MQIMGILNFTPDSFSDGGKYYNIESALLHAEQLIEDGADIIDFGAESTNPLIEKPLTLQEEFDRVKLVLPELIKLVHKKNKVFSIDTYKPDVAKFALEHGADIINDQSGCKEKDMILLLAQTQKKIIVMHSLSLPARRDLTIPENVDVMAELYSWAEKKIEELISHNILKENIMFDPGIGLGKTHTQSLRIMREVYHFKDLGVGICIGHSRKGCIRDLGDADADAATLKVSKYLSDKVECVRVHDVKGHYIGIKSGRSKQSWDFAQVNQK